MPQPSGGGTARMPVGGAMPGLPGLRNGGFAPPQVLAEVRSRTDWFEARQAAWPLLGISGPHLIDALGYEAAFIRDDSPVQRLTSAGQPLAVALKLAGDGPSRRLPTLGGVSWTEHALAIAAREGLPWLIMAAESWIRLYPVGGGGAGPRDQRYVQLSLGELAGDEAGYAGYLTLLYSPSALRPGGSGWQILAAGRLRERIPERVLPRLGRAVAAQAGARTAAALDRAYQQTLLIVLRTLFLGHAEASGLLPAGRNPCYDQHSVHDLARQLLGHGVFHEQSTGLWGRMTALWAAVAGGRDDWGVPAWPGGLFGDGPAGGLAVEALWLTDAQWGPALRDLLVDTDHRGHPVPTDFSVLSTEMLSTIYEEMLDTSLSIAPAGLTRSEQGVYLPAAPDGEVHVQYGQVYLDKAPGRWSAGSYYTPPPVVGHLLDAALRPALDSHLRTVVAPLLAGDHTVAAVTLFDFAIADLAMGTGRFLVPAIDWATGMYQRFLADNPIVPAAGELARLAQAGPGEPGAGRLRQQIARSMIYGVDLDPVAVSLAQTAVQVHTFEPGLPVIDVRQTLVQGNSLTGLATVQDLLDASGPESAWALEMLTGPGGTGHAAALAALRAPGEAAAVLSAADSQAATQLFDAAARQRVFGAASRRRAGEAWQGTHFPLQFPQVFFRRRSGFNVLLGNPPWGVIRLDPAKFWARRQLPPGFPAAAQGKRQRIEALRDFWPIERQAEQDIKDQQRLISQVATSSLYPYQLQAGGGAMTYDRLFAERFLTLLGPDGWLALVLPGMIMNSTNGAPLRRRLGTGDLFIALATNTMHWLFSGVTNRMTVALVARGPASGEPGVVVHPVVTSAAGLLEEQSRPGLRLPAGLLSQISDSFVIPRWTTADDPAVFGLLSRHSPLGSGDGWITGRQGRQLDFRDRDRKEQRNRPSRLVSGSYQPGAWEILKSGQVKPYKIARDITRGTGGARQFIADPAALTPDVVGSGITPEGQPPVEITPQGRPRLASGHPVIVFRYVTKADNDRTLIASALPATGYLPNRDVVHTITTTTATGEAPLRDVLALLGVLNSIVTDWWIRRLADRSISAGLIEGVRLPVWSAEQRAEVAALVHELLIQNGTTELPGGIRIDDLPRPHEGRPQAQLRAEIDAAVLAGFGLGQAHLETILADFTILSAEAPVVVSGYRLPRELASGRADQPAPGPGPGRAGAAAAGPPLPAAWPVSGYTSYLPGTRHQPTGPAGGYGGYPPDTIHQAAGPAGGHGSYYLPGTGHQAAGEYGGYLPGTGHQAAGGYGGCLSDISHQPTGPADGYGGYLPDPSHQPTGPAGAGGGYLSAAGHQPPHPADEHDGYLPDAGHQPPGPAGADRGYLPDAGDLSPGPAVLPGAGGQVRRRRTGRGGSGLPYRLARPGSGEAGGRPPRRSPGLVPRRPVSRRGAGLPGGITWTDWAGRTWRPRDRRTRLR